MTQFYTFKNIASVWEKKMEADKMKMRGTITEMN